MNSQTPAWDELTTKFLGEKGKTALEWSIGAAFLSESKKIVFLHGPSATGKTTILNFVREIFEDAADANVVMLNDVDRVWLLQEDRFIFAASSRLFDLSQLRYPKRLLVIPMTEDSFTHERYAQLVDRVWDELDHIDAQSRRLYQKLGPNAFTSTSVTIATQENH